MLQKAGLEILEISQMKLVLETSITHSIMQLQVNQRTLTRVLGLMEPTTPAESAEDNSQTIPNSEKTNS